MRLRYIYLCLCLAGAALPSSQLIPWLAANGLNMPHFFQELFSTRIGGFFGMDVIVSAVVLFVFIKVEGGRLEIKNLWIPVIATLVIGVSLGLPLFLYMRQLNLDAQSSSLLDLPPL